MIPNVTMGVFSLCILWRACAVAKWEVGDALSPGFGIPIPARARGLSMEQRPAILPAPPNGGRGLPGAADVARGESG